MGIEYYETTIQSVVDYFIKGFKGTGRNIHHREPFIDSSTGKIILRLFVDKEVPQCSNAKQKTNN